MSLHVACGKTSVVGGHGTPNTDSANAATTGCLTYAWTHTDAKKVATANTCYFCNGFAKTGTKTEAVLNLPAFKSPVTDDMKVDGWLMIHTGSGGTVNLLLPDIKTKAVMKTLATTACGGPASIMKSGKGLKVTWTMTT